MSVIVHIKIEFPGTVERLGYILDYWYKDTGINKFSLMVTVLARGDSVTGCSESATRCKLRQFVLINGHVFVGYKSV